MKSLAPLLMVVVACAARPADVALDGGVDAGSDPQRAYTYPGCDAAAGEVACPNGAVFQCAIEDVRAKYVACASDADCTLTRWDDCVGLAACSDGLAVAKAGESAFLAEAGVERDRYCAGAPCHGGPDCAFVTDHAACVDHRCVAVQRADAGTPPDPPDAGRPPSACWNFDAAAGWHAAPWIKNLPLTGISVDPSATYWEVRQGASFLGSVGELCPDAADRAACQKAFRDAAIAAGDATCTPATCAITFSWQGPNGQGIGLAWADAFAFLGEVTSEEEAVLVANIAGYHTDGSPDSSGVRTAGDHFEVVGRAYTAVCDPVREDFFLLEVPRSGAFTVLCHDLLYEQYGICI